ncbi:hypothetical protein V5R04_07840 [Jonesiaceae bacterium BS-20]|uniref:Uncharacterized protein n=1 Tax=Jonesiaceae bacterium BS-20 TaxID=3120821 RepID=A0AAU7DYK0_9MICO
MQTPDSTAADDEQTGNAENSRDSEPESASSAAQTPEEAWEQIVAQLSDLSTKAADEITAPPEMEEKQPKELSFPTAPWVTGPRIEPVAQDDAWDTLDHGSPTSPRDWDDDQMILESIDRFIQPDPALELSADPVRNVGWFLTILAGLALLISAIFMRPVHGPSMLILLALFLGGIALLIWRMPTSPGGSSGSDSGAVV